MTDMYVDNVQLNRRHVTFDGRRHGLRPHVAL